MICAYNVVLKRHCVNRTKIPRRAKLEGHKRRPRSKVLGLAWYCQPLTIEQVILKTC